MNRLLLIPLVLFLACEDKDTGLKQYIVFADTNWSLYNWITNTSALQDSIINDLGDDWIPDVNIIGTHHLDIVNDSLVYSSDCLYDVPWSDEPYNYEDCILPDTPEGMEEILYNETYIPSLIQDSLITLVKNRDFYDNIGKYDQFVAGWEGILENYIIRFRDVGDSTEIIISSPIKEEYLNLRNTPFPW